MNRHSLLALAAAALTLAPVAAPGAEQLIDGIAAQVGTRVVLISEVLRMIEISSGAQPMSWLPRWRQVRWLFRHSL